MTYTPKQFTWLSDMALQNRYEKILKMQSTDKNRFKQNALGDGYLTRNERYMELRWQIEPELLKRYENQ